MKEILEQMLTVDPSVIKDRIQGLIDILVLQEQNRIVEEIEKEIKAQEILSDEKEFRFHCKSVIRVLYRLKQTLNK